MVIGCSVQGVGRSRAGGRHGEAGKIGGMLTSRKKQKKKAEEAKKDDGTV